MGQKRGRDPKARAPESKKRKKAAKSGPVADDDSWDGVVGIDDLNWTEVALPDRLADATGFLGLEEIDGVDIIKSSGSGEVHFKVCNCKSQPVNPTILTYAQFHRPRKENRESRF